MSDSERATTSSAQVVPVADARITAAIEGWQTLTGLTFNRSPQDIWQLAAWFRDVRALVQQAHLGDEIQPATVFMPAGAGPLPTAPRELFRLSPGSAIARPGPEDALAFLPVAQLARLVQSRQVSPVEVTRVYLNRCAAYNTHLCCVITLMADAAMEQARAA